MKAAIAAALLMAALQAQTRTPPPVLGVSGTQFTVNGAPRFLLFVSYFDALRASDLDRDFRYIAEHGFDGVRILPNWYHYAAGAPADDDALFTSGGSLRDARWLRFIQVLESAAAHGLLVDVSFTRDTVSNLSHEAYGVQLRRVAEALRGQYPNVLFDLQNEFPIHMSPREVASLLASYVRPADPRRIVTASIDAGSVPDPVQAGRMAATLGLTVVAYHEERDPERWFTEAQARRVVDGLRQGLQGTRAAIYLQEPMAVATLCPPRCQPGDWDSAALHARDAARAARDAGAAAWTFHTRSTFDLAAATLVERLEADPAQRAAFTAFRDF